MSLPFLGRSRELAALRVLVENAGHGVGQAAVLRGEAGIGKTRLLAEIATHAARKGFQVLAGTTDELSRDRPLGALIEAFELERAPPIRNGLRSVSSSSASSRYPSRPHSSPASLISVFASSTRRWRYSSGWPRNGRSC